MKIKFYHANGWIELKVDAVIEYMRISTFKKWAKLFAKYGTVEQHKEFLERLQIYIGCEKKPTRLERYKRMYEILEGLVS